MRLVIQLFAGLRERAGAESLTLEDLPDELDLAGLKSLLEERHPELGSLSHVRGVVGTAWVPDRTMVTAEDEVSLLPPVSGGSAGGEQDFECGVFELSADPLDPASAQARVSHPTCGANVLFTGTTRQRNRDKDVVELDYEAFQAMAFGEMRRIFEAARMRYGPDRQGLTAEEADARRLRMLVLHRSGVVGVGDPSVIVAVASPHRDGGFKAARFLIDELKAHVPLWKREVYRDGHHWIAERS